MVTLRENSILDRLQANDFSVMQSHSLLPFSDERMQGLRISKCFTAYREDSTIHDEFGGIGTDRWEVSVYYMEDSANATKLVDVLEGVRDELNAHYEKTIESLNLGNVDGLTYPKRYLVYRYNDIVVFGDYQSVSLVRGY
jgi:hypothetical protein